MPGPWTLASPSVCPRPGRAPPRAAAPRFAPASTWGLLVPFPEISGPEGCRGRLPVSLPCHGPLREAACGRPGAVAGPPPPRRTGTLAPQSAPAPGRVRPPQAPAPAPSGSPSGPRHRARFLSVVTTGRRSVTSPPCPTSPSGVCASGAAGPPPARHRTRTSGPPLSPQRPARGGAVPPAVGTFRTSDPRSEPPRPSCHVPLSPRPAGAFYVPGTLSPNGLFQKLVSKRPFRNPARVTRGLPDLSLGPCS